MDTNIPAGKEICGGCGGDGYIPCASYGEGDDPAGYHACYRCATTGYVPAQPA